MKAKSQRANGDSGIEIVVDLSSMDPAERAGLESALDDSEDNVLIEHETVLRFLDRVRRGASPLEWKGD